ncbi:MAG: aldo/keto reductase [Christensenellaceae bacterium]|nr:aldo/keto reductase [Christensenellaceae bacterium]
MELRQVGKTGLQASVIGLGGEYLDGEPCERTEAVLGAALDGGVNILDLFMPGSEVRENIAKALGRRRAEMLIQGHIGSTNLNEKYDISRDLPTAKRFFEELLRLFGYIDFGMLFFIDSLEDFHSVFDGGLADYALKLKQNGDIRHIGFSSHSPRAAKMAIETGLPEMMMFSVNLAFDLCPAEQSVFDQTDYATFSGLDPERAALYALCEQRGVGITVMKTYGAGKLLSPEHTPFGRPMTEAQCIHYALSRPAVASALIGCKSVEELNSALAYLNSSAEERDYAPYMSALRKDFQGSCVYCSHCQPCPVGIDIAAVHRYLDISRLNKDAIPPSVRAHYGALAAKGSACINCASCEKRCPFGVPVQENMRDAATLFGE